MSWRTALVTGASSGIGAGLARELAKSGTEVALVARRADKLEALAAEIRGRGGAARVFAADLADPAIAGAVVQQADTEMGGLDLVVANAGVGRKQWSGQLRWEDCEDVLAINIAGATATLLAVMPRMVERGRGHLVGVSSIAAYRGLPGNAAYSASKAYLAHFLEALRIDLLDSGVAVTDVRPGFVRTPMTAVNDHPMPMIMEVEEAVGIILRGLRAKKGVVAFPRAIVTAIQGTKLLPDALFSRGLNRAASDDPRYRR